MLLVQLEPAVDRLFGVVVALDHPAAARVAGPVDGGWQVHVVDALAVLAHPAPGQAVEHDGARDVEVDREVEGVCADDAVELLGLVQVAREAVEHEPVVERAARREALLHQPERDLVGDELALVHVALGLEPERGAVGRLVAKHVAGRKVREAKMLSEARGLGALAGTLLAQQHQARLRRQPGQLRNPS